MHKHLHGGYKGCYRFIMTHGPTKSMCQPAQAATASVIGVWDPALSMLKTLLDTVQQFVGCGILYMYLQ